MHLWISFILITSSSAFAQSTTIPNGQSRFRPWLEKPSFYALTKNQQEFWDEHVIDRMQLNDSITLVYQDLDAEKFNQALFLENIIARVSQYQGNCKEKSDAKNLKCRIQSAEWALAILREDERIDDVAEKILINALDSGDLAGNFPYVSVQKYWNKLRQLGTLSRVEFGKNPYQNSKFNWKDRSGGWNSARQRLFLNYSYLQINAMGRLIDTYLKRMNSAMTLTMDYDHDGTVDDSIPFSEGETEAHAKQLLERLKERARAGVLRPDQERDASPYLNGLSFNDTDLLLASVETGRVPIAVLEILARDPEINDVHRTTAGKILRVSGQVGITVAKSTPILSGFTQLSFLVWDTYSQMRREKKRVSNDVLR